MTQHYLKHFAIILAVVYSILIAPALWQHQFEKVGIIADIGVLISIILLIFSRFRDGFAHQLLLIAAGILLLMPFVGEFWRTIEAVSRGEFTAIAVLSSPLFYAFALIVSLLALLVFLSSREIWRTRQVQ